MMEREITLAQRRATQQTAGKHSSSNRGILTHHSQGCLADISQLFEQRFNVVGMGSRLADHVMGWQTVS